MHQQPLKEQLSHSGIFVSQAQADKLDQYLDLLQRWNKHINLTAINNEADTYTHHLLDSISVLDFICGDHVLDLGTGGGLPGLPLAILQPKTQVTLLDARNKKISFLLQVKAQLQLENIYPLHLRVQDYHPEQLFDCVVCRAFASLDKIYQLAKPLLKENGRIISMKGRFPDKELAVLDHMKLNYQVKSVDVSGLNAQRHIVTMT